MTATEIDTMRQQPWYFQHLPRSLRKGKTVEELHALRKETYLLLHPPNEEATP